MRRGVYYQPGSQKEGNQIINNEGPYPAGHAGHVTSSAYAGIVTVAGILGRSHPSEIFVVYSASVQWPESPTYQGGSIHAILPSGQRREQPHRHLFSVYSQRHHTKLGPWQRIQGVLHRCSTQSQVFSWSMKIRPVSMPKEPELFKVSRINMTLSLIYHSMFDQHAPQPSSPPKVAL